VMRQQRPRDRRFLLPVAAALILMTSLSGATSASAVSLMAAGGDHRVRPVRDDETGPSMNRRRVSTGVDRRHQPGCPPMMSGSSINHGVQVASTGCFVN